MDTITKTQAFEDGQRFKCPKCGRQSVVKIKKIYKDFKLAESYPVCIYCQTRLDALPQEIQAQTEQDVAKERLERLSSLFGGNDESSRKQKAAMTTARDELASTARHFCRDCRHFINHPFLSRCGLTNHQTEPMDDCPKFTAKILGNQDNS